MRRGVDGRPSILKQVQKMVISKSVHKMGQNTRKLASKLTETEVKSAGRER